MNEDKIDVKLRPIDIKDAFLLMELNNNKQIADYVVGNPTVVDLEQQINWIKETKKEKSVKRWIISFNGEAVGTIILSSIDLLNGTGNVNIKLLPSFQRKGIAKKSLKLLCDIAFDELGLCCLTANVLSFNNRSKMLFENFGFHIDGILRSRVLKNGKRCDLIALSLLKEERSSDENERNW